MSDSYISDLAARSYRDKDGMITYSGNRNQFQTLLNKQRKSTRMMYSTMSDLEIFLESLSKIKGITEREYNDISGIAADIDKLQPNTIKYRSPVGLFYAYKYSNINSNKNQIEKLLAHVKDKYPNVHFQYVMVDGPDWMRPSNLPVEVKDLVMKKINLLDYEEIVEFRGLVYDHISKKGSFSKFKEMDDKLNQLRNEHWKDANPELYEMLKEYYE